ncbi:MAG: DNA-binding transcriptional regulator [Zoogloea sp.]|nr:DNA-binding transcriptional regulator [Zoogloea sp.]
MRTNSGADYAPVRGLTRGLDLLRALNSQEGGRSTLAQLAQATGLHRTTVRRLLETLIAEGYVRRSESDDRYCLALRVRSLAEGFRDEDWISSIAAPALSELLQSVVWPSDLTTQQGANMVIRESTHRFSPLSFHRAMVGQTLPMLLTAAGRAFFAHSQGEQREQILELIRGGGGDNEQARLAADDRFVTQLVARTLERGFASNDGEWTSQSKIGALALPILFKNQPVGVVNIVYLNRAVTLKEAVRRYLPALQKAASRIEAQLTDAPPTSPAAP